jgi:hypothetical protein
VDVARVRWLPAIAENKMGNGASPFPICLTFGDSPG